MKDVFEIIAKTKFIQIHKYIIVSIALVETIERHQLKVGGVDIPIGKTYRKTVLEFFKTDS